MGNSNSGAGVNSGVDAFLLGVGVELELLLLTLELELELEWLTPGVTHLCPTLTEKMKLKIFRTLMVLFDSSTPTTFGEVLFSQNRLALFEKIQLK
jgi:hypothetical protein